MCLAILKPVDKKVTRKQLRNGFMQNPDGAGFSYVAGNKLQVKKGYFTFKRFYKALRETECNYPKSNFIIHFRIGTSGEISREHCHPFVVDDTVVFAHNGVFIKLGDKKESDTQQFNRLFLKTMPRGFIHNAKDVKFLKGYCGYSNKLIFLSNKNDYLIVNEGAGQWVDGVWFSNVVKPATNKYGFSKYDYNYDYDDEGAYDDWQTCSTCCGYYPEKEMQKLENGHFLCSICQQSIQDYYYTIPERQQTCYYCGREIDVYDDEPVEVCPYCDTFLYERS